jgi:putative nucleotidyltransferase with HDIG domain
VAAARRIGADEEGVLYAMAVDRMPDIVEHSERVARYSAALARDLRVVEPMFGQIQLAARFHDIGKLAVPKPLMTKPAPLTAVETAIMRRHVDAGAEILASTTTLAALAPIVRSTHEWFGGGGYPARLVGSGIPLPSRIIAVVDAYDAMTQDRVYRVRFDSTEAVAELLRCASVQFDPDLVVGFLTVLGRH